jgi:hypothetical protein
VDSGWHRWTIAAASGWVSISRRAGARRLLKAGLHLTFPLSCPLNLQSATGYRIEYSGIYGIYDTHNPDPSNTAPPAGVQTLTGRVIGGHFDLSLLFRGRIARCRSKRSRSRNTRLRQKFSISQALVIIGVAQRAR